MTTRIDEHGVEVNVRYASEPSDHYQEITRKRRVVRNAFDKIRHDKDERLMVNMLAKILGGKIALTPDIMETAHSILGHRRS